MIKKEHKRISEANPNIFIELVKRHAASSVLRQKMAMFIESVVIMASNGNIMADVRCANTLIPGHARVAGHEEPVFGYLWESCAYQPSDKESVVTATCFLSINERNLFFRLYGNNPEADATLLYHEFVELPSPTSPINPEQVKRIGKKVAVSKVNHKKHTSIRV